MKRSVPEIRGQAVHCVVDGAVRIVFDLDQDALHEGSGYAGARRRLQEMARHDRVYGVVAIVAHSHRQLHGVTPDLAGIHIGLRRHDIVERRQAEPSAGQQEDTEILRVPVRGTQQPEHDLGF